MLLARHMKPTFFKSASAFRAWLAKHHGTKGELWVGFYKKASGKKGLTYPDAVDTALGFGWIDGLKKRVDDDSYVHRFSPRKAGRDQTVTVPSAACTASASRDTARPVGAAGTRTCRGAAVQSCAS